MVKVNVVVSALDMDKTLAEKRPVYSKRTDTAVVASTKSLNNLLDDYKLKNESVAKVERKDFFVDRNATEMAIADMVVVLVDDIDVRKEVTDHIMKALDGACLFKKLK